jgi:hypothetical protein
LYLCNIDSAGFITSLLLCPQLQRLYIKYSPMTADAIAALPVLECLTQLVGLVWHEPADATGSDLQSTLDSLAELSQLKSVSLGCNSTSADARVAAATQMHKLECLDAGLFLSEDCELDTPSIEWDVLSSATFSQLLTTCTLLTHITMRGVVLDQAGLDLLLSHPHITHVALLAIAATESRVDSPCSWQTLELPYPKDVRTVAYVPLHSLKHPLNARTLLLPPDVPTQDLPQLLQAATSRMAEHRQLFNLEGAQDLCVTDCVCELEDWYEVPWAESEQDAFTPEECVALVEALNPATQIPTIQGLSFSLYNREERQQPARIKFGKQELEALSRAWGSRLVNLELWGVQLAEDFFPAIETAFPKLVSLRLHGLGATDPDLRARLMLVCQRMTQPLSVHLDYKLQM